MPSRQRSSAILGPTPLRYWTSSLRGSLVALQGSRLLGDGSFSIFFEACRLPALLGFDWFSLLLEEAISSFAEAGWKPALPGLDFEEPFDTGGGGAKLVCVLSWGCWVSNSSALLMAEMREARSRFGYCLNK